MFEQLERHETFVASAVGAERRRPGRVEYASPHLIGLLRAPLAPPATPTLDDAETIDRPPREADSLAAARGIGASAVLGAAAWAGLLIALWRVLNP